MDEEIDCFHIYIIGEMNVGKTTFHNTIYSKPTVGYNVPSMIPMFERSCLKIDHKKVEYCFWDIPGQLEYRSSIESYIRKADGLIYMANAEDLLKNDKSQNIIKNFSEITQECALRNPLCMYLDNKIDLIDESNRDIIEDNVEEMVVKTDSDFGSTCSAKNPAKCLSLIKRFMTELYYRNRPPLDLPSVKILNPHSKSNSKPCC